MLMGAIVELLGALGEKKNVKPENLAFDVELEQEAEAQLSPCAHYHV